MYPAGNQGYPTRMNRRTLLALFALAPAAACAASPPEFFDNDVALGGTPLPVLANGAITFSA